MENIASLTKDPGVVVGLVNSVLAGRGRWVQRVNVEIGRGNHVPLGPDNSLTCPTPPMISKIIDAFAGVPVLSTLNPVLACGLRRNKALGNFSLILRGDRSLHPDTIQHIQHIWTLMVDMSKSTGEKKELMNIALDGTIISFAMSDLRLIFMTVLKRMLVYKEKADAQIQDASEETIQRFQVQGIYQCFSKFEKLLKCTQECNTILQQLPTWNQGLHSNDYSNWKQLSDQIVQLKKYAESLLGEDTLISPFDRWERLINQADMSPKSIRKDIGSMIRLPRHLLTFKEFATSNFAQDLLRCTLKIVDLEPLQPESAMVWPSNSSEWEQVRDHIYNSHKRVYTGPTDSGHGHDFQLVACPPACLHPELALITHLHHSCRHNSGSFDTYNYISISGLTCKACCLWIRSYNEHYPDIAFGINESHNEWVAGWAVPALGNDSEKFRTIFIDECLKVFLWFTKFHRIATLSAELSYEESCDQQLMEELDAYYGDY